MTYLTESSSEHPLAKAIVNELGVKKTEDSNKMVLPFELVKFTNFNGEGVEATVRLRSSDTKETFSVYCGNDKLMDRFNVQLDINQLR